MEIRKIGYPDEEIERVHYTKGISLFWNYMEVF